MSRDVHSASHHEHSREEIALAQRDDELSFGEGLDYRQTHERTIARLRLFWSRRDFLLRAAVWGIVLSTVIAFLIPSRYTSTTRLMPPDNTSSSGLAMVAATLTDGGGRASGLSGLASDLLGLKSTSDTFAGILNSRTAEDALIQKFNLKKLYWDSRMEDARRDLQDRTDITVDRKTQIVTLRVTDHDPRRAAAMSEAYVEELNKLVATLSTSSARRERIFLEGRLHGVNQDLETAEKEFSQFASKNTAINIPEQGKAMVSEAATVQGELIATESELEGLKQIYTDNNVRVRTLTARLAELRRQFQDIAGKDASSTDTSGEQGALTYPSIRKLPLLGVTYADLYRNAKVQEAIFETLTQEYEMAKVEEAKEIPTVRVLDSPDIPDKKSFPPRLLFIFLGAILAFSGGIAFVLGKARWESVDAADPGKLLMREVFGSVKSRLTHIVPSKNGSHPGTMIGPGGADHSDGRTADEGRKT
jgi:capsule polysaccharide export protein KpsE/RkpR